MSKKRTTFIAVIALLASVFVMNTAKAANANIGVSSNSGTIIVGSKVTVSYTISSGSALGSWTFQLVTPSNFTLNSCNNSQLANQVGVVSNSSTKSVTISCTFTAKSTGTGVFTVKNYQVEDYNIATMSTTVGSKSIKVITQKELEASYSKNNNLKALSVTGYEMTPEFTKDTLIYNVELPPETYNATITATKEDNTATVEGAGDKELVEGLNTFNIVVTAQNKSTKTYTVNITVKELEPIKTSVNGEDYTVVRKKGELKVPNKYFEETVIQIEGKDVPAFINETTKTLLVGLKDKNGVVTFYIYNEENNSYTLFRSIESNSVILEIVDEKGTIPNTYEKQTIEIDEETYTVYKLNKSSKYSLFVAVSLETGEKNIYMYDELEKTVQRYNKEEINALNKEHSNLKKTYEYIILGIGSLLIITFICLLISLVRKKNKPQKREVIKEVKMEDTNITREKEALETEKKTDTSDEDTDEEVDFFDKKIKKKKK